MLPPIIRIVAALMQDDRGHILLVRKRGTADFMLPGGKPEPGESNQAALARELTEEIGHPGIILTHLGDFTAPAANEPGHIVHASVYAVALDGPVTTAAEIDAALWIDPAAPGLTPLAPLARQIIFHMGTVHD